MTDETARVRLREGEAWVGDGDGDALLERYGGLYLYRLEGGVMFMGIPGKGEVSVDSLLMGEVKLESQNISDNVTTLKPRRAD